MSIETIATIIFLVLLTLLLLKNRKKLEVQKILGPLLYIALFKTQLGLKQMDSLSKKYPKLLDLISRIGVLVGIAGIFVIAFLLIKNVYDMFFTTTAVSGVALVLPFQTKIGFYVPFFYWIISIFFIAIIHEFSHGVVARLHKVSVKASGFAILGIVIPIIPAAFVSPNEKTLAAKSRLQKLSVFAAGPFSNIVSGFMILGLFLMLSYPVASNVLEFNGVTIEGFTPNSSSEMAGVMKGSTITQIDSTKIALDDNLSQILGKRKVGDTVALVTTNGSYTIKLGKNPENASQPYLGILVSQSEKIKPSFENRYGTFTGPIILWFLELLYWIFTLSVGIGLFNLVPVGPVDGGLMAKEIFSVIFKNEKTALKAWKWTSFVFFALIMISLLSGFIRI